MTIKLILKGNFLSVRAYIEISMHNCQAHYIIIKLSVRDIKEAICILTLRLAMRYNLASYTLASLFVLYCISRANGRQPYRIVG